MVSIAEQITSISGYYEKQEETSLRFQQNDIFLWKSSPAVMKEKTRLVLGDKILIAFGFFAVLLFALFITSLYRQITFISPKFSFFLFLLFGGLALEVMWTKKISKDE